MIIAEINATVPRVLLSLDVDFTRHVQQSMDAGVIGLARDVRQRSPIDTGDLRDGFYGVGTKVVGRGEFIATFANDTPAALYRVRGRGPGRMPPIDAIAPWARRRGLSPFLVARGIARRGTERWRDNDNVLDIERSSRPGNEVPKSGGVLIQAANAMARNIDQYRV